MRKLIFPMLLGASVMAKADHAKAVVIQIRSCRREQLRALQLEAHDHDLACGTVSHRRTFHARVST